MEIDPRVLITILETLDFETRRLALDVREGFHKTEELQRHFEEHSERFVRRVSFLATEIHDEKREALYAEDDLESAKHRTKDAEVNASDAMRTAQSLWNKTSQVVSYWISEVGRARLRVSNAEAWIRKATQRISAAESSLASARSELSSAEASLASCRQPRYVRDTNGNQQVIHNDCSGQHSQVIHAEQRVSSARAELQSAQEELAQAKAEHSAAQVDLSQCEGALGIAKQAQDFSKLAVNCAESAEAAHSEAASGIATANPLMTHIIGNVQRQETLLVELETLRDATVRAVEDGCFKVANITPVVTSMVDGAILVGRELTARAERLQEFDLPGNLSAGAS